MWISRHKQYHCHIRRDDHGHHNQIFFPGNCAKPLSQSLSFDLLAHNLSERLTMTLTLTIVGLSLILEDQNLLVLALSLYLSGNLGTINYRLAYYNLAVLYYSQNLIKSNNVALSSLQLLNSNNIALSYLVLLATSLNNCVHSSTPPYISTRQLR